MGKCCFVCGYGGDILDLIEIVNPMPDNGCGDTININVCGDCLEKAKTLIIAKCITCGAYGEIPITPKSVFYFAESNLMNGVATTNYCPNCVKVQSLDANNLCHYSGEGIA